MQPAHDSALRRSEFFLKRSHPKSAQLVTRCRYKQETRFGSALARPSREAQEQSDAGTSLRRAAKPAALRSRHDDQVLAAVQPSNDVPGGSVMVVNPVDQQRRYYTGSDGRRDLRCVAFADQHDRNGPRLSTGRLVQRDDLFSRTFCNGNYRSSAVLRRSLNDLGVSRTIGHRPWTQRKPHDAYFSFQRPRCSWVVHPELRNDSGASGTGEPQRETADRSIANRQLALPKKELPQAKRLKGCLQPCSSKLIGKPSRSPKIGFARGPMVAEVVVGDHIFK